LDDERARLALLERERLLGDFDFFALSTPPDAFGALGLDAERARLALLEREADFLFGDFALLTWLSPLVAGVGAFGLAAARALLALLEVERDRFLGDLTFVTDTFLAAAAGILEARRIEENQ